MKLCRYLFPSLILLACLCASLPAHAQEAPLHHKAQQMYIQNADTVGWLQIPGTGVDEVVVQYTGDANQFYLRRNFEGAYDYTGALFADYRCVFGEDMSRNTTLYGYSEDSPDGARLSGIKLYRDPGFLAEHPCLYFATRERTMAWQVFAVSVLRYDVPYAVPDQADSAFLQALEQVRAASLHNLDDIPVGAGDRVLTLSTQDYSADSSPATPYRFVVMAKLVEGDSEGAGGIFGAGRP